MKLVKAIIRPEKLSDVLKALYQADVRGLTVSRVQGHGGETDSVETYRGTSVKMELTEKVMLDIGVSEGYVEAAVEAVINAKIFVLPVEAVHRIRTGERDQSAVTPVTS
jgi:nitrogen regulatory protein P-II 1